MKQRYHYNVANVRVEQHVVKGNDDGLYISSVACCQVCSSLVRCRVSWCCCTDVTISIVQIFAHVTLCLRLLC